MHKLRNYVKVVGNVKNFTQVINKSPRLAMRLFDSGSDLSAEPNRRDWKHILALSDSLSCRYICSKTLCNLWVGQHRLNSGLGQLDILRVNVFDVVFLVTLFLLPDTLVWRLPPLTGWRVLETLTLFIKLSFDLRISISIALDHVGRNTSKLHLCDNSRQCVGL